MKCRIVLEKLSEVEFKKLPYGIDPEYVTFNVVLGEFEGASLAKAYSEVVNLDISLIANERRHIQKYVIEKIISYYREVYSDNIEDIKKLERVYNAIPDEQTYVILEVII